MKSEIEISIVSKGIGDIESSNALDELKQLLCEQDVTASRMSVRTQGVKDSGITVGLNIAGLAFSALSTLLSVMSYYISLRPEYSITVRRGEHALKIKSLKHEDLRKTLDHLIFSENAESVMIELEKT